MSLESFIRLYQELLTMVDPDNDYSVQCAVSMLHMLYTLAHNSGKADPITIHTMYRGVRSFENLYAIARISRENPGTTRATAPSASASRTCWSPPADMSEIRIGTTTLSVKDYECSPDDYQKETYLPKRQLRLWLYINVTSRCNAGCPFCVNPSHPSGHGIDPAALDETLARIAPLVSGVSLTGGEPMLDVSLLERAIEVIDGRVDPETPVDLVTNGVNIDVLPHLRGVERLATIHVSRHATDDDVNRTLMGWRGAPSKDELTSVFASLPDPGCTVLNCVLQKGGVRDHATATEYLEMAADMGAANVSFIGMIPANAYCRKNRVAPEALGLQDDERTCVWNRFRDHGFCRCMTGDFRARSRYVRFYWRSPTGIHTPDYCGRVIGADGVLRQGFGDAPAIRF